MFNAPHDPDAPGTNQSLATQSLATMSMLVAKGLLTQAVATRLQAFFQGSASGDPDIWNITQIKRNPGAMINQALAEAPQLLGDSKRKDADQVVALARADLEALVLAAGKAAGPNYATGQEMYARLARPGPPLSITLRGLPDRNEPHMSVSEALAAQPVPHGKESI